MRGVMTACALVIFSLPLFAQQDIRILQTGFAKTLASNATWTGVGLGTLSNNYIYTPTPNTTGACISIQNNDASAHDVSIGVWGTGTSNNQVPFGTAHAAWYPLPTNLPSSNPQVPASGTQNFFGFYSGSAQVAIVIAGTSGAGTASIFIVESSSPNPCQGGPINVFGGAGPSSLLACDRTAYVQATASGTVSAIPSPGAGFRILICGFTATTSAALTGNGYTLIRGTGATCGTGTATMWGPFQIPVAVGSLYSWGGASGLAIPATAGGNRVCITSAATAGTVDFNIWYTSIP
jgi:hypothetical protein